MFRSYYGPSFNPFDKHNAKEKDRFLSKDISEMTSRLDYLKDTRGIGLFTARPGMGNSFAMRCFAKSLNPNFYHMEYICLSTVSASPCTTTFAGSQTRKWRSMSSTRSPVPEAPPPSSTRRRSPLSTATPGAPRLVDNLMIDALTLGAQMDKKVIDTDVILASVSSQNLG